MGVSTLNYTDFTPLAQLFNEYLALAVKADSPVTSGKDAVGRLAKNPQALSVAIGTSLGNTSHLALSLAVKAAGGDIRKLRTVVFGSNGEAMTALLGGHVDAMMTSLPNLVRHIQAGTVRAVAISAPQRVGGVFAEVPTWREQGSNIVMSGWRGVVAPKGVTPAQVAYWEGVFAALGKTDEWMQELEKNFWHGSQLTARESREYLAKQYAEFRQMLTELGMAKSAAAARQEARSDDTHQAHAAADRFRAAREARAARSGHRRPLPRMGLRRSRDSPGHPRPPRGRHGGHRHYRCARHQHDSLCDRTVPPG